MDVFIDKTTGALAGPDIPPEQIEPQSHQIIYDPLGTQYCLDCILPIPTWSVSVGYPVNFVPPTPVEVPNEPSI